MSPEARPVQLELKKHNIRNLVILAGGLSSRMKESIPLELKELRGWRLEAKFLQKGLMRIGPAGTALIDYLIYNAREAGLEDIVIVTGDGDESKPVREYFGQNDRFNEYHGVRISYAVQKIVPPRTRPLGSAEALYRALELRKNDWVDDEFIVCNCDNLYSARAYSLLAQADGPSMIDYDIDGLKFPPERIAAFGITIKDADGCLKEIIEKPSPEMIRDVRAKEGSVRVSMNIFRLRFAKIVPFLLNTPLHPIRRERELPIAVTRMIKFDQVQVKALPLSEHVPDLTTAADYDAVNEFLFEHYTRLW